MAVDYHTELGEIVEALAAHGLVAEADALRNAIASGSTATEVLMAARWQLQQSQHAHAMENDTRRKIRELLGLLEKELA